MRRLESVLVLVLGGWLALPLATTAQVEPAAAIAEEALGADEFLAEEEAEAAEVGRTTVVPWTVTVLGKNFDSFPNDEASIVLGDWLLNSLIELNVFNIVNRDKMQAIISEQQLAAAGYSEDISPTALADAGKLLKVNYILFGNFKNLGKNSEVDFKLLDVDTATYTHRVNFQIPFNPEIESMKPEIDRIVAKLAADFPIVAEIGQILDDRRLMVGAGTDHGVNDSMEAEVWSLDGSGPYATGFVISAWNEQSEVELDQTFPDVNLFDHVVHIKIMPPAQAALNKGLRDLGGGDYEGAAATFAKGLAADPEDGLLHANYARSLWKTGNYPDAIDSYRKAIDMRPDDVPLLEDAAEAMLASGRAEEVIVVLEDDQRRSGSGRLSLSYGKAQETLGHYREAAEAYRSALRDDPNSAETHLRLAVLAAKQDDFDEAQREFVLAERGGGDSLEQRLGSAAFRLVGEGGADPAGLTALADEAQAAGNLSALATAAEVLLVDEERWPLSLDLAKRTLAINPDYVRASMAAARAHAAGGENAPAIALLDSALQSYPNHVAMLLLSAELLTKQNNVAEAESRYRRAADLAPADWSPLVAIGDLYSRRGDHLKATSVYLEALERAEAAGTADLVPHLERLSLAAVAADQLDTARPYLERCVAQAPDNLDCHFNLGLCLFGDETPASNEKAIQSFTTAQQMPGAYYYLGTLNERQAHFDEALRWHRSCVVQGCEFESQSQKRVDAIESIAGTVTQITSGGEKVTLDVGKIHGVTHGRVGVVIQGSSVVATVEVEEVREDSSVAVVGKRGEPLVGQTVRFRPTSPKGLAVKPHPKKGVVLTWRPNREAEVDYYLVLASSSGSGGWKTEKKVRHPDSEYVERSIKAGEKLYFKVVAVSETDSQSPPSKVVEAAGK